MDQLLYHFQLIKRKRSLEEENSQVDNDLAKLREKYWALQENYQKSASKISKGDQRVYRFFFNLKNENRKHGTLMFRIEIVLICLSFSVIFSSLVITTYDKIIKSSCGFKCEYQIQEKMLLNRYIIYYSSNQFPIDYLFFFIFTLYNLFVLYMEQSNVQLFFQKNLNQKQQTQPSSLFIAAAILNISILVVCNQQMTLCPQYATFGNQHYYDIKQDKAVSKMETIFIFFDDQSIHILQYIFAVIFFLQMFIFGVIPLMIIIFMCKKKDSQIDFNEDDESQSLINL